MEYYVVKHKDISILYFEMNNFEVSGAAIFKNTIEYLPLMLKRIIHNADEFIELPEDETFFTLNDEGSFLIDYWLSNREIPVSRDNYNAYVKKGFTARQWMLENHAMSFTDCYWIEKETDNFTWKDICEKLNTVDHFVNVQDENRHYKGTNATLGGQLEKFWYKENDTLKLCKKNEPLYDILSAREIIASLIYEKQGMIPDKDFCKYDFIYDKNKQPIGVSCNAFTNVFKGGKNTELVTAYILDLTTKDNYKAANEYLKETCPKYYVPIPDSYIGEIVIMEYDTDGGSDGNWYSIHGNIDQFFKAVRATFEDYLKTNMNYNRHKDNTLVKSNTRISKNHSEHEL